MANLNSHPLVKAAYEACLVVEKLPASAEQTAAISAVSALLDPIESLALELAETRRERDAHLKELLDYRKKWLDASSSLGDSLAREHTLLAQRDAAVRRWERLKEWGQLLSSPLMVTLSARDVLGKVAALEASEGETAAPVRTDDAWAQLRAFCLDRADIVDGSDGPRPDDYMRVLNEMDRLRPEAAK